MARRVRESLFFQKKDFFPAPEKMRLCLHLNKIVRTYRGINTRSRVGE